MTGIYPPEIAERIMEALEEQRTLTEFVMPKGRLIHGGVDFAREARELRADRARARRRVRPLTPRRAAEFRGRRLKRIFGDRRKRATRFARLADLYGREMAIMMSRMSRTDLPRFEIYDEAHYR